MRVSERLRDNDDKARRGRPYAGTGLVRSMRRVGAARDHGLPRARGR